MRLSGTLLFVVAVFFATPVDALDIGLTVFQESEYTTNSGRTAEDEIDEWIHSPGARLTAYHDGPNLSLDIDYSVEREIYQEELFDDQTVSSGSANLRWNALPERLDFTVNHTRTQSAIRSIGAVTPDNRQETTNTSAGPTLRFNPRGSDELLFQYLWGDRSTGETSNDATTHDRSISYVLNLNATSNLAVTGMSNQVQYDDVRLADIEYTIGQLTWERQLRNLTYSLMGGFSKAERTKDLDDVNGLIFDTEVSWQLRPSTNVRVSVARDIRDQSAALDSGVFAEDFDFSVSSDLGEVFTNDRSDIVITQQLDQTTTLALRASLDQEDYEDVERDTDRKSFGLAVNRRLNRQMVLDINLDYSTEEEDTGDDADTSTAAIGLTYAAGRRLNIAAGIRFEERDSADPRNNSEEWAGFVRVSYDLLLRE